jgi:hypothetical protein
MTREEAIEYSKAIWKRMAIYGYRWKDNAIFDLRKAGIIPRNAAFEHDCPLCELYNSDERYENDEDSICQECPWPGNTLARCQLESRSPYFKWDFRANKVSANERRRLASAVYKLVKTFK